MEITKIKLIKDILIKAEEKHSEKTAVIYNNKNYSYKELLISALALANALQKKGLKRTDRIGIYMDNTWECVVSIFGISMAGGVFFLINPQTKSDKLEYILDNSDASFLITDKHLEKNFIPILNNLKKINEIICSGTLPNLTKEQRTPISLFDNIISDFKTDSLTSKTIPTDLAALIYTSGSTGNPKGVMMTHQSMVFTMESLIEYLRLNENDKIICPIPVAFDYGLYQILMTIRLGATIILERSFIYPAQVINSIKKNEATVFPGVPTIYKTLISMYNRSGICMPSIKKITNTAAALSPELIPKLKNIFPNALIFKMYGITECKRISYLEPENLENKIESVGKAIPGTEIFILTEDGQPTKPGEIGILHVKGPHIMIGYWKSPEQSKLMLKEGALPFERILCTQDWFIQDKEGYFYFKGRSDDIIKTRGEKVSPVEVENVLYGLDGIKEVAILGSPDDLLGEKILAYVATEKDSKLTENEIKKYCNSKLENFMIPKEIIFLDELPKTTTGKIQKKGLKNIKECTHAK